MARLTLAQVVNIPKKASEIASVKPPGTNYGGFQRKGQAWFCTSGLPSDIIVEVDAMLFHLHKFPLISRSGKLSKLVAEAASSDGDDDDDDDDDGDRPDHVHRIRLRHVCRVRLQGMPGGPEAFELVAKFCYGVKVELMATNVAALRCAAEYLKMTEEYGEKNLIALTESFLSNVIIRSWKDSLRALKSCESLLPIAEELSIVEKCVDSIVLKACTNPSLFGWPMMKFSLQSPDGTLLWNGISTGARPKNSMVDWWYEDVSVLNLPLFKCVIRSMEEKGLKTETIAGALMYYAKKTIPGLNRRQEGSGGVTWRGSVSSHSVVPCDAEQLFFLETIESLLPSGEGVISTRFLLGFLKIAMILKASMTCRENLEKRIGAQLEQATLDDLLIPTYSHSLETLYDVDCVQRIVQHFLGSEKAPLVGGDDDNQAQLMVATLSSATSPLMAVAKLLDAYLAEIASDVNLKLAKFQALGEALPHYARVLDDGLYRAIDIFLKAHPWMREGQREGLCNMMDCQKLSLEACTHAAQNQRLPLRVAVQVLFMEQTQLRAAIVGFLEGGTARPSSATPHETGSAAVSATPATNPRISTSLLAAHGNQALRLDLAGLRRRVAELERESTRLRRRLRHNAAGWASLSSKLSCRSFHAISDISGPPYPARAAGPGSVASNQSPRGFPTQLPASPTPYRHRRSSATATATATA